MKEKVVMTFEVVGRTYTKNAGKTPIYKVRLKTEDGDLLTFVSDSKDIYEGYLEGEAFSVTIMKTQKTMSQFVDEKETE